MSDRVKIIPEELGGSPLARAAAAGTLPRWYGEAPATAADWEARCREVAASLRPGWLEALIPAFGPGVSATEAGRRLARAAASPHGAVVTSGQQPGLFGGPVYTWSKALSALALADRLERDCKVPVAAVFWAATDDADFAEASSTVVAVPGGAQRLAISPTRGDAPPMSRMPLGDDVTRAAEALASAAGSAASADVLALARRAYVPGASVGDAYVTLLRALLEPLGVAVLDASHPAVRAAAHPMLIRALERAPSIESSSAARLRQIEEAGYDAQVPDARGLSLVFTDGARGKTRVAVSGAHRAAAKAEVGTLGPNVLLRPVVERHLLPTVAYMGGPGEIAYFAQVSAVADALEAERPLVVPRWSCTLLEPHVERILRRLGLDVADLADPHAAESRLARASLPDSLTRAIAELRDRVHEGAVALARAGAQGDATLLPRPVVEGLERNLLARVDRVERRAVAAQKRVAAAAMRDVATARGALYPFGTRQERALNLLPLLARHGTELLGEMRATADLHAAHLVGGADRTSGAVGARDA